MAEIEITENADAAAARAADLFLDIASGAINERGQFSVSLSGGSTPKKLYKILSSDTVKNRIDWSKTVFFIGDERSVPETDERSNFRMINETLLRPLGVTEDNVSAWPVEDIEPEETARLYELGLEMAFNPLLVPNRNFTEGEAASILAASQTWRNEFPVFDLVLLGLGDDCHTASLFPGTRALEETEHMAVANWVPQLNEVRFTMTFPVINNARNVLFLVTGKDKAAAVADVIEGEPDITDKPAQGVAPETGRLIWLLDRPAASALTRDMSLQLPFLPDNIST